MIKGTTKRRWLWLTAIAYISVTALALLLGILTRTLPVLDATAVFGLWFISCMAWVMALSLWG